MAWNTSYPYTGASTAFNDTLLNNIAGDLRAWGGNVDAAGYNLSGLGLLTFGAGGYVTSMPIGEATALRKLMVSDYAGPTQLMLRGSSTATRKTGVTLCIDSTEMWHVYTFSDDSYSLRFGRWGLATDPFVIRGNGNVGINKTNPGAKLAVSGLATYADNTAAVAGELTAGDFYRTSTGAVQVVY